jgi:hypothetical protein
MPSECQTLRAQKIVACVVQATKYVDSNGDNLFQEELSDNFLQSSGTNNTPIRNDFTSAQYTSSRNDNGTFNIIDTSLAPFATALTTKVFVVDTELKSISLTVTAWQANSSQVNGIGPVRAQLFNPDGTFIQGPVVHDFGNTPNYFPVTAQITITLSPTLPAYTPFMIGYQQDFGDFTQRYQIRMTYN